MASEKALKLSEFLDKNLKTHEFQLKPWTELEKGLFLAGTPDNHGELRTTSPGFPKTDAYLGLNEKAPIYTRGAEKATEYDIKASLWLPIHDRPPFPGIEWLSMAVSFVEFAREQKWSIIVHCVAGLSRSAMVMTAYLMERDGLTVEQAIKKILNKRPININPAFIDGLYLWQKCIEKS